MTEARVSAGLPGGPSSPFRAFSGGGISLRHAVHGGREFHIAFGKASRIMARKRHLDLVVDIEPFRMIVEFFGNKRDARHEAEGFVEILEGEFLLDRLAACKPAPPLKLAQGILPPAARQFSPHAATPLKPFPARPRRQIEPCEVWPSNTKRSARRAAPRA